MPSLSSYLSGAVSICDLIRRGDCSIVFFGDSITTNGTSNRHGLGVRRLWRPDRWAGAGATVNNDGGEFLAYGYLGMPAYAGANLPAGTTDPTGVTAWSCYSASSSVGDIVTFSNAVVGADTFAYTNRIGTVAFDYMRGPYNATGLPWPNTTDVIEGKFLCVRHAAGLGSYRLRAIAGTSLATGSEVTGLSSVNASQDFIVHSTSFGPADYTGVNMGLSVCPTVGYSVTTSMKQVNLMASMSNGRGLRAAYVATGGSSVGTHWSNAAYISTAALTGIRQVNQYNNCPMIAYVSLGTNDAGGGASAFGTAMNSFATRLYTAGFTHVVFAGPYQASNGTWRADQFYDQLALLANSFPNAMSMNRWLLMGGMAGNSGAFSMLNTSYLTDGTHTNTAGANYMCAQEWMIIEAGSEARRPRYFRRGLARN